MTQPDNLSIDKTEYIGRFLSGHPAGIGKIIYMIREKRGGTIVGVMVEFCRDGEKAYAAVKIEDIEKEYGGLA